MSKKRYLEAETLKEFLRMGMKVGHIHTLRDVENYIDTQPEATPQEVAGCWSCDCRSRYRNWADVPAVVLSDSDDLLMRRCRPWN